MTTEKTLAKLAGGATVAALLLTSSVALAQTPMYDTGANGSGSAGTIVPSQTIPNTTGATDPVGGNTSVPGTTSTTGTTPGIPNTGTDTMTGNGASTPGVPNTGAGGDATTTALVLGVSALVAIGGAAYLARQKFAVR